MEGKMSHFCVGIMFFLCISHLYAQGKTVADSLSQTEIDKQKEWVIKFGGFIQADYMLDVGEMEGKDGYSAVSIKFPSNNRTSSYMSIRQSQLRVNIENKKNDISGFVEIDFYGNNNTTAPRLRQAYIIWKKFLVGQSWSNFSDLESSGEIFDFTGPDGLMFSRQIQVRYTTKLTPKGELSVSLENPDAPSVTLPKDSLAWQKKALLPGFTAAYRYRGSKGYLRLAGILSPITYEMGYVQRMKTLLGFGVNLSGAYYINSRDSFKFQTSYGSGYSTNNISLGGMGYDAIPDIYKANKLRTLPLFNLTFMYEYWWAQTLSSVVYISSSEFFHESFIPSGNLKSFRNAGANIIYHPFNSFRVGFECTYGKAKEYSHMKADAIRYQISASFKF